MALRRKKVFHTFDQETAHVQSNKKIKRYCFINQATVKGMNKEMDIVFYD